MRAKFIRNIDAKDAMETGDPDARNWYQQIDAMKSLAKKYNLKIKIEGEFGKDTELYTCVHGIHNKFIMKYFKPFDDSDKPFLVSHGQHSKLIHFVWRKTLDDALNTLEKYIKEYLKNKKEDERI